MSKVGQKRGVRVEIIYREIPLGGVNMFLIPGLRPATGIYISIFTVDLAGNKRLIEFGYGMDIITFNLLFKLQIYSRDMEINLPNKDHRYHKFVWPI